MRALVAFVALWLLVLPGETRADAFYDTYIATLSPTAYWPLGVNGNAQIGGNNATCSGSCTFGLTLATHVAGFKPVGGSSTLVLASQPFTNAAGFQVSFWFGSSSSSQQVFLYYVTGITGIGIQINRVSCVGGVSVDVTDGGSTTTECLATGSLNDSQGHMFFMQCYFGTCTAYVDAVIGVTFSYTWSTFPSPDYHVGNYTSGLPVLGAMGGLAYWAGGSPFTQQQINLLYICGTTGSCGQAPAPTCPGSKLGLQLKWCENFAPFLAAAVGGCGNGTPPIPSPCITQQLNTNTDLTTLSGAIGGTGATATATVSGGIITGLTLVLAGSGYPAGTWPLRITDATGTGASGTFTALGGVGSVSLTSGGTGYSGSPTVFVPSILTVGGTFGGALKPGQFIYDSAGGMNGPAGNVLVDNSTFIIAQADATHYAVTVQQTVAAENMAAGDWLPFAYLIRHPPLNRVAIGVNGGGVSGFCSGNCTYRLTPSGVSTKRAALDFQGDFADATLGGGWNVAEFGFTRSTGGNCGPCVRFGTHNSPPSGFVNLELFDAQFISRGNVNVLVGSHGITIDTKISPGSDGFANLYVDGSLAVSYSGVNAGTGVFSTDMVEFVGQLVGASPAWEAAFGDIGLYMAPTGNAPAIWLQ